MGHWCVGLTTSCPQLSISLQSRAVEGVLESPARITLYRRSQAVRGPPASSETTYIRHISFESINRGWPVVNSRGGNTTNPTNYLRGPQHAAYHINILITLILIMANQHGTNRLGMSLVIHKTLSHPEYCYQIHGHTRVHPYSNHHAISLHQCIYCIKSMLI